MGSFSGTALGLDVGEKRIGVARVHSVVKIAEPLAPIDGTSSKVMDLVAAAAAEHNVDAIVIGLPRGLDGQETAQTKYCRTFAQSLLSYTDKYPIYLIDEAGSSKEADLRIGKRNTISRDSMAAAVFLEDFVDLPVYENLRI